MDEQFANPAALNASVRFLVFVSPLPALAIGLWLQRIGDAPASAQAVQVMAGVVSMVLFAWMLRGRGSRTVAAAIAEQQWLPVLLATCLFVPLIGAPGSGPARWLLLGSIRLYLAPIILPLVLFQLGASRQVPSLFVTTVIAVALALLLQPDASQLTAFALAMTPVVQFTGAFAPGRGAFAPERGGAALPILARGGLAGMLLIGVIATWRLPDPLAPVPYVEGVFRLAADVSPWALAAAVLSAVLPVATLAHVARQNRSVGVLAVAVYLAGVFALAPLQVTPVPLLGFGAGPILGYFLAAGLICHEMHRDPKTS